MNPFVFAALVSLSLATPPEQAVGHLPDILFLLADDIGDEALPLAPTPNLDSLASVSARFPAFYCQTLCSPTRVNFLTGRQPLPAYGIGKIVDATSVGPDPTKNPPLPKSAFTVAEMLKCQGYRTAQFGKWHVDNAHGGVDRESPRTQGFDEVLAGSIYGVFSGYGGDGLTTWTRTTNGKNAPESAYNTTVIADEFVSWWSTTASPRFAWVGFNAAHAPFHAPPPALIPPGLPTGTDHEKHLAMIAALDTELGRMLAAVDLSTTVVVFAGDNGTPTAAVGPSTSSSEVKGSLYDGGISPPFFVAGWWVRPGTAPALIEATDLFATLAELVDWRGFVPEESLSFAPSLLDPSGERGLRTHAVSARRSPNGFGGPFTLYQRMARSRTHKLIVDGLGANPTKTLLLAPGDTPIALDPAIVAELEAVLAARGL